VKSVFAAAALICFSSAIVSCSDPLQENQLADVAQMRGGSITRHQFSVWSAIADKSTPSRSRDSRRQQVMRFLISARWIEGEAQRLGINPTRQQLETAYRKQSQISFNSQRQKLDFMRSSGMGESELRFRARINMLADSLRRRASSHIDPASNAEVAKFYLDNQQRFGEAASRDIMIIRTKDIPKALIAKKRILDGESFSDVAAIYSDDEGSRAHGGRLRVSKDRSLNKPLEDAVFGARPGKLVGPIRSDLMGSKRGDLTYYLFQVVKDNPSARQPIQDVRPVIMRLIESQKRRQLVSEFLSRLENKWRALTSCRSEFKVDYCRK